MPYVQAKSNQGEAGYLKVDDVTPYLQSGKYDLAEARPVKNPSTTLGDSSDSSTSDSSTQTTPRPTYSYDIPQSTPIDENAIREEELKRQQARLDAINKIYDEEYARANERAYGRQGTQRAMSASRGILGSDFAAQEMKQVDDVSQAERRAINAQKAAEEAAVYGTVDAYTRQRVQDLKAEQQRQQDLFIAKQLYENEQRRADQQAAFQQAQFDWQRENALKQQAADEAAASRIRYVELNDGSLINPDTGELIYEAPRSTGYEKLSEGQTLFDPVTGRALFTAPKTVESSVSDKIVTIDGKSYIRNADGTFSLPKTPDITSPATPTQLATVKNAIDEAWRYADAAGPGKLWEGIRQNLFGDTGFTNLSTFSDTIKSNMLAIGSDPGIKKFFGPQMNTRDVELMMAAATSLDPEKQGPETFKKELAKIQEFVNKLDMAVSQGTESVEAGKTAGERLLELYKTSSKENQNKMRQIEAENPSISDEDLLRILGVDFNNDLSMSGNGSKITLGSNLARVNNNPGNLRFAGQDGATQGQGGFARFPTPEAGVQALKNQISLDASRGHSLQSFLNKYAPPSENDTGLYVQQLASWLGVNPQTPISKINLDALTSAIMRKESSSSIG